MNEVIRYVEEKTGIKAVIDEKGKELPFSTFPEVTMDLSRCLAIPYVPLKLEDWFYQKVDKYIDYCKTEQGNQTWMISGGG